MDVIHSFFLPNFRVKQDAMPGIVTEIWFTPRQLTDPEKPLEIACAEHCGLGHYGCAARCTWWPPPSWTPPSRRPPSRTHAGDLDGK
jgi:cytochrome c oxidase subunit 2